MLKTVSDKPLRELDAKYKTNCRIETRRDGYNAGDALKNAAESVQESLSMKPNEKIVKDEVKEIWQGVKPGAGEGVEKAGRKAQGKQTVGQMTEEAANSIKE